MSFDLDEGEEEEEEDEEEEIEDIKEEEFSEEEEELNMVPKKKIRKNPDVDTSFLPDREREEEENRLREELRQVST